MSAIRSFGLACALAGVLFGCRWVNDDKGLIRNTADDYLTAQESKPLVIPDDMKGSRIQDAWPIPEITEKPLARRYPNAAPRPEAFLGAGVGDAAKIQKLGKRSWMVVSDAPSTVWPVVKQFLADNGIAVAFEAPAEGRIDGTWLALDDSDYRDIVRTAISDGKQSEDVIGGRDRIRFKIEQGIRRGSSEIHLRHENDASGPPSTEWPESSSLTNVEDAVLGEFGSYYAAGVSAQSVSKVALDISTETKAAIERDEQGHPQLRLNIDFDRAWAVIGQALRRANVDVKNVERDSGLVHVEIQNRVLTGRKPSFFSRVWPGGGEDVTVVDIRVASSGATQLVQVLEREGGPVPDRGRGRGPGPPPWPPGTRGPSVESVD